MQVYRLLQSQRTSLAVSRTGAHPWSPGTISSAAPTAAGSPTIRAAAPRMRSATQFSLSWASYTCYGCAIMFDHVHLLIRKHRDLAEEMMFYLQEASRAALIEASRRTADHPTWGGPGWKVFLNTREDMERVVRYIAENPIGAGRPAQHWPFVQPYDGWLPGIGAQQTVTPQSLASKLACGFALPRRSLSVVHAPAGAGDERAGMLRLRRKRANADAPLPTQRRGRRRAVVQRRRVLQHLELGRLHI